jgi:hypothetical protein
MDSVTQIDKVHPTLLRNVTTQGFMKLMNFGLWVQYKSRSNENISMKEVVSNELYLYKNDLIIKSDLKASNIMCMEGLGVCIILTKKNCFWPKIIEIGPPKNFSIFEQV